MHRSLNMCSQFSCLSVASQGNHNVLQLPYSIFKNVLSTFSYICVFTPKRIPKDVTLAVLEHTYLSMCMNGAVLDRCTLGKVVANAEQVHPGSN